jgi:hypothetical protein
MYLGSIKKVYGNFFVVAKAQSKSEVRIYWRSVL